MLPHTGERWSWSDWERNISREDFAHLIDDYGNSTNLQALAHSWFCMLGDSPVDREKPYRVCGGFYARLSQREGLSQVISEFAALGHEFLHSLRRPEQRRDDPLFRRFAKTPIFREYMAWSRSKNPALAQYILTFLWWGRKPYILTGTELTAKGLNSYLDIQEELASTQVPHHVLLDMRRLIRLSGFRYRRHNAWPKHGPRQVANRLSELTVKEKNSAMRISRSSEKYLRRLIESLVVRGQGHILDLILPDPQRNLKTVEHVVWAYWTSVFKDESSRRTICMEPLDKMFFQQGILEAMLVALERSKLSEVVNIFDQMPNRASALRGSIDGSLSTIDLSGASDRLRWEIVDWVFHRQLVNDLDDVRSVIVKVMNTDILLTPLTAFPMGSANCFVNQCLIFSSIVALAHSLREKSISVWDYLERKKPFVTGFPKFDDGTRIYGDDIIVSENLTETVIVLLEALGFKVNKNKSFSGSSAIRESCGIYAYLGADITPIMFRVQGLEHDSYESWLGVISLANRCYDHGYISTRDALVDYLPWESYIEVDSQSPFAHHPTSLWGNSTKRGKRWSNRLNRLVPAERYDPFLQTWYAPVLTGRTPYTRELIDNLDIPLAQEGVLPLHDDLEAYYYGAWLKRPGLSDGRKSPRHGLSGASVVELRWTPVHY